MSDKGWECVTIILDMISDINIKDDNENTLLHHLVNKGNKKAVNNFLNRAENEGNLKDIINQVNSENETALHLSVKNNCQDISKLLINKGANKNIKNKDGEIVMWKSNQDGGGKSKKIYGLRKL